MALVADALECPNCGAPVNNLERLCTYCHSPVIVRRTSEIGGKNALGVNRYVDYYKACIKNMQGDSAEVRTALGVCLLEKGAYREAVEHLERAVSLMPENGDCFYYLALANLQKKRPYLHTLPNIKRITQYLDSALEYEDAGRFYYLSYLIQSDFYDKKRLRNGKNAEALKTMAIACEVDDRDIAECNEYCNM